MGDPKSVDGDRRNRNRKTLIKGSGAAGAPCLGKRTPSSIRAPGARGASHQRMRLNSSKEVQPSA